MKTPRKRILRRLLRAEAGDLRDLRRDRNTPRQEVASLTVLARAGLTMSALEARTAAVAAPPKKTRRLNTTTPFRLWVGGLSG